MSKENKGYGLVLKQKEYCKLIISNMVNRFGDSIDSIAFTWLVYEISNNAVWSAIIFGINRLPTIFLQPIAGAIVENRNKKFIMILADIIRGICVGFIAILYFIGYLQPWMLIITTLIISSVEAFSQPASSAVVINILDKENYEYGVSMNSSISTIVELIGLGMAGVIISQFGIAAAIVIDAATFFLSSSIKSTINTNERKYDKVKVSYTSYIHLLKDGAKYIRTKRIMMNIIILAVLANAMLVPFNSLLAPLTKEVLGSGEEMLTLLGISLSLGMLLSSVVFPFVYNKISGKFIVAIGGSSIGFLYLLLILFGHTLSGHKVLLYGSVAISTFIAGLLITFLSMYINVTFIKTVDQEYIARTSAILNAVSVSAMPIVSFILSGLVAFININIIFIVCGIILVLVVFFIAFTLDFEIKSSGEMDVEVGIGES